MRRCISRRSYKNQAIPLPRCRQNFTFCNQRSSYSTLNNFAKTGPRDHYFNDKLHFFARGMQDDAPSNLPTGLWGANNYPEW